MRATAKRQIGWRETTLEAVTASHAVTASGKEDEMNKTADNPFLTALLQRDARYDGVVFADFLRAVLAKRLFKTGV